ncbi:MAG: phage holin family protein [Novosphingobium pentaromativorans]|uniref:Phage holin family protein n=1 Tax=Novosphingobium pentaromativorans TaxID=205844 RepID=A0A2W5QBX5_9SPHN|nr:phage holin family protein [Novosphingobium panipatense]PZQ54997.1 MAG: phage holin family protein [Novosphingobium pentaromativorans]
MLDTQAALTPAPQDEDLSLVEDVRLLIGEARTFAQAEVAYQKTRAAYVGAQTKAIAVLGLGAVVLVIFAVMALVLGAVIAVGTLIGPWLAMIVVPLAILIVAAIMGISARNRSKKMLALVLDKGGAE